jgi:hypothetical protein
MTVVAAVIVKEGTVHVSDSWLSAVDERGRSTPVSSSSGME